MMPAKPSRASADPGTRSIDPDQQDLFRPPPSQALLPSDALDKAVAAAGGRSPALLTPAEVAALLAVTARTLERWRMSGDGPEFLSLTRKTVRYTPASVAAFLATRTKANTAQ